MKFDIFNNVEINILDAETRDIKKSFSTHNKATRNMVKGIISFLSGNFTYAHVVEPDETDARKFIPCFIGFGSGGFNGYDSDGVPIIDENWNGYVDYNSTKLVKEIPNSRSRIRKIDNTFVDSDTGKKLSNAGDMDSIILHCEISPDVLNAKYQDEPVYVSEIGLFPSSVGDNMLACVRTDDFSMTQEYTVTHVYPGSEYGTDRSITNGEFVTPLFRPTNMIYSMIGNITLKSEYSYYSPRVRFHLDENNDLISENASSWSSYNSIPDIVIGHLDRYIVTIDMDKFREASQFPYVLKTEGNFNGSIVQASVSQETKVVTIPALILQPNDVMSIKWTITIASIGHNSTIFENKDIRDETGDTIDNNVDGNSSQISKIVVIDDH